MKREGERVWQDDVLFSTPVRDISDDTTNAFFLFCYSGPRDVSRCEFPFLFIFCLQSFMHVAFVLVH